MADVLLRSATDEDVGFLREMLYEAAHWRDDEARPPIEDALASPEVAVYVNGWRREGDRGILAEADGESLGAAWHRSFSEGEHGYGFVDAATPELTIAVVGRHRGKGVGRAVLAALLLQATLDGLGRLSLSVEEDNRAKGLYERLGFRTVLTVGNAHTMVATLGRAAR